MYEELGYLWRNRLSWVSWVLYVGLQAAGPPVFLWAWQLVLGENWDVYNCQTFVIKVRLIDFPMLYRMDESLFNTKLEYLNLLRRSDSDSVFSSAIWKSELNIWLNLLLSPLCLLFSRVAKSQMTEDDSLSHGL